MPRIHLSPATIEDRDALHQLHKDARFETDVALLPAYAQATVDSGYYEKLWNEHFPGKKVVIKAELDGKLAGFCRFGTCAPNVALYPEEYPDEQLAIYKEGLAELDQIYVHRDFRGKYGVGQALYRAAFERLKKDGYRHILIAMYAVNEAARRFYQKRGASYLFTETHRVNRCGTVFHNDVAIYLHRDINQAGLN